MKVKLVLEKSYEETRGLSANTFSKDVDVVLPQGYEMAHLVSARCYYPTQSSDIPMSDATAVITNYEDESRLVGKLLTYIDATFTDTEQRKAHKDIVKDLVYGHMNDLRTRADHIIDSQTKEER